MLWYRNKSKTILIRIVKVFLKATVAVRYRSAEIFAYSSLRHRNRSRFRYTVLRNYHRLRIRKDSSITVTNFHTQKNTRNNCNGNKKQTFRVGKAVTRFKYCISMIGEGLSCLLEEDFLLTGRDQSREEKNEEESEAETYHLHWKYETNTIEGD